MDIVLSRKEYGQHNSQLASSTMFLSTRHQLIAASLMCSALRHMQLFFVVLTVPVTVSIIRVYNAVPKWLASTQNLTFKIGIYSN